MKKSAVPPPPPAAENLALALAAARAREEGLRQARVTPEAASAGEASRPPAPLRSHDATHAAKGRFRLCSGRALRVLSADLLNGLSDRVEELLERMHRAGQPTARK